MTNREKLLNTNIYDLLVAMNKTVMQISYHDTCILDILEQEHLECKCFVCDDCIQKYLNKEV